MFQANFDDITFIPYSIQVTWPVFKWKIKREDPSLQHETEKLHTSKSANVCKHEKNDIDFQI